MSAWPHNKAMKLTRLAAAPGRMRQGAAAWPRRQGAGVTASQLIAGVRRTWMREASETKEGEVVCLARRSARVGLALLLLGWAGIGEAVAKDDSKSVEDA